MSMLQITGMRMTRNGALRTHSTFAMATQKTKKLTKAQREILQLLEEGQVMTIDQYNMASIGKRGVGPQTRYFLTNNKYVTKIDKTKSVETKGNGYIITEEGRKALSESPAPKSRGPRAIKMVPHKNLYTFSGSGSFPRQ